MSATNHDLEFARNLARQMEEGHGRLDFNFMEQFWPIDHIRIIRKLEGSAVRAEWRGCHVGEFVKASKAIRETWLFERVCPISRMDDVVRLSVAGQTWLFKRVVDRSTDEVLWRRIQ